MMSHRRENVSELNLIVANVTCLFGNLHHQYSGIAGRSDKRSSDREALRLVRPLSALIGEGISWRGRIKGRTHPPPVPSTADAASKRWPFRHLGLTQRITFKINNGRWFAAMPMPPWATAISDFHKQEYMSVDLYEWICLFRNTRRR